jgi:hypothetical protein
MIAAAMRPIAPSPEFPQVAISETDPLRPSIGLLLSLWQPALERFHFHLERLNPRLRYLLPPSLPRHVRFLMRTALRGQRVTLGPGLRRLGARLRERGFELSDLDMLGAAWLAALEDVLGERLTTPAREEWVKLYRVARPALGGMS